MMIKCDRDISEREKPATGTDKVDVLKLHNGGRSVQSFLHFVHRKMLRCPRIHDDPSWNPDKGKSGTKFGHIADPIGPVKS